MKNAINSFRGQHYYLSNFYAHPVTFEGLVYPTNENAFQAAKLPNNDYVDPKTHLTRHDFIDITPSNAKKFGRTITLRDDWETIKDNVMRKIVMNKFKDDELQARLVATQSTMLREGNSWHDKYWGVNAKTLKGQNKLGQILMATRLYYQNNPNQPLTE